MTSLNLLVVDDSAITIKKLTKIVETLGHKVICIAKNGRDAVDAYEQFNPDLVTMDITMPGMNGIEATKQIMEKFSDALIIMVTSHGQEEMVMDAIEAGAKGYVIKPFKPEKIDESINKVIEKFLE